MKTLKHTGLYLLLLWLPLMSLANELEIINLNHRPAKDLIPILKPLLAKNASISGEKHVLFIRTSEKNLRQIKAAIKVLDADLRQLKISIMQESAQTMKQYGYSISKNKQATNANIFSTTRSRKNPRQQNVQVTEGQWATLQTGISVPEITRTKNSNGTITESIQYQTVITRLKIQPVIVGKKINIKIQSSTGLKRNVNQNNETRGINTTVTGNLGEWIALGGITTANANSNSGFIFSTQRTSDSMQQIFVKVEISTYQD